MRAGAQPRRNILHLAVVTVVAGEVTIVVAGITDFRIAEVRPDVSGFSAPDGVPVSRADRAVIAATTDGHRGVVLLGPVDPVIEVVIRRYVVKLSRWLIVLWCPRGAAVYGDSDAAVVCLDHALRIRRINPELVIVSMGDGQRVEKPSAIRRTKKTQVEQIHSALVLRISEHVVLIPGPHPNGVVIHHLPGLAVVVRAIQGIFLGFDHGVNAVGIRSRNRHSDSPESAARKTLPLDVFPRVSAVARFVKPAAGSPADHRVGGAADLIHRREENVGIVGIKNKIRRAGLVIHVKDFLPGFAAVARAEHTTLLVWSERMSECGNEDEVGIMIIDKDFGDVLAIAQADIRPRFAAIDGFVKAVAIGNIVSQALLARADIEHVRIRWSDRDRADGGDGLSVEDGCPGRAAVDGFPNTSRYGAEIINARVPRHAGDGFRAAAAKGPDEAPFHPVVEARGNGLGPCPFPSCRREQDNQDGQDSPKRFHLSPPSKRTLQRFTSGTPCGPLSISSSEASLIC